MPEKKKRPSPWLIALFVFLGTMLNVPIFAFGGYFRLGAIPIWIGAYFAAKGTQHLIDKRKYQKELKKNSPGNIPYSRDRLPPEVLENLELYQGYEDEVAARVEYYARTFWINPEWKDDIIKDFSRKPVGEEEKEISKHKDKTTSKEKERKFLKRERMNRIKESIKDRILAVLGIATYSLFMVLWFVLAFLILLPLKIIGAPWWLCFLLLMSSFLLNIYSALFEPIAYIWALVLICRGGYATWITVLFWIVFVIWAIKFLFFAVQFVCAAIKDISNAIQRKRNKDF